MTEDSYCGVCGRLYGESGHQCPKGTLANLNKAETKGSKLELASIPTEEIPVGTLITEGFRIWGSEYEQGPSERVH